MSTARQKAANQENSKKSTGPVTAEGKVISSRNRVSAGFNSTTSFFLEDENGDQFWQLLDDFTNQYQPANPTEQVLVEKMVHNQWLSLRAIRYQRNRLLAVGFGDPMPADLGLLIRYQTAADRGFFKAQTELVKSQKERQKCEIGFVSQNAVPAPQPDPEPITETPSEAPSKTPSAPPDTSEITVQPEITFSTQNLIPEIPNDSETFSLAA